MTRFITGCATAALLAGCVTAQDAGSEIMAKGFVDPGMSVIAYEARCPANVAWSLAIHGGAGVMQRESMSAQTEADYRATLTDVMSSGRDMLNRGHSALDTAQHMIMGLEDDPKFNAGKGAVFSAARINEMDASIMDGRQRDAGAVSSVTVVRNPILAARAVLDYSRHVLLSGEGAEQFARSQGLTIVPREYFQTQRRRDQLEKKLAQKQAYNTPETRFGTVGAVVKDGCGDLAAATSTGGLTAKEFGRVGDTPIIGAGTYADNKYCAVSATGTGEYFIRGGISKLVCTRMEYIGEPLQTAMDYAIHTELDGLGGDGGIIGVGADGSVGFSFNTKGMYRGAATSTGVMRVEIFELNESGEDK
ncbi:isoaspartyl peptidase/L-asparaginase family protein [Robiginitomaculum antarcticum]|uniref:isoaspartyl peptidase/L-asparaginase family protein n=1 Tax=Robiginitomaculum antarcticum TaxID=437507 RepID=UPI00036C25F8|nr:isoaspartyl peptidase/L-asparaginase [Robiginitomaculum antarcticum]